MEDTQDTIEHLRLKLSGMSKRQKFAYLDGLVLDNYITALSTGGISPIELAPIVTYLKNNKTVQEKQEEETESDLIDKLIE